MLNRIAGSVFHDRAGNLCEVRSDLTINVVTLNEEPSLTIQSEKDSCDINKILANFNSSGVMGNIRQDSPLLGDFSDGSDYHSALNRVNEANEAFMALPAELRKRFDNDPGNLISFLNDPQNASEAVSLGLVNPPQDSKIPQGGEADSTV